MDRSGPADLRDALKKLYSRYILIPSNVVEVRGSSGLAYFFVLEQKQIGVASHQAGAATTYKGIACLLPGKVAPSAPIFSIGQWPPGTVKALAEMKANLREDVGGEAFRQRYYVEAPGYIGNPDEGESEPTEVEVSRELEQELLAWAKPTGLLPDWSSIVIRDELVMATLMNRADDLSADVWRVLLDKCERVGRVLREGRFA